MPSRAVVLPLALFLVVICGGSVLAWEIDATDTVDRVIDGGTFVATSLGRVRLSDIDTPEIGEPGADEATQGLNVTMSVIPNLGTLPQTHSMECRILFSN